MTNAQIRERCDEAMESIYTCKQKPEAVDIIESLCREMIAEGLERAAKSCDREQTCDDERSYYARAFRKWCREQAKKVQQPCTTEDL